MQAASLQFFISNSFPKALKTFAPPPLTPVTMKDRPPPSSYGSVYIPPHHRRLRSVITTTSSASPPQPNLSPVHNADPKKSTNNNTNSNKSSTFVNSSRIHNPYPYLPHHQVQQLQQQQKNSQLESRYDEVSEEGSVREMEISIHPVSFAFSLLFEVVM